MATRPYSQATEDPFADGRKALGDLATLYGAPKILWHSPKLVGKATHTQSRCGSYLLVKEMGPRGMLYSATYTPKDGDRTAQRIWVERTEGDALWKLQRFHELRHTIGEVST